MTIAEARRRILSQQGLIEAFADPLRAVRAMVAVQTQYAASLPTAVAARTKKLPKDWEASVLVENGPIVKSWSVRHTLHAHLREDHALILGCIGDRYFQRYQR